MIWAHQWGKTACDSLSYRSEHNEEDTAITPPKKKREREKKDIPEEKRKGGEQKRHIINTNTPLNYFKRDFIQFLELVLWEKNKQKGKQICLRGGKQTSANDTICHMLWTEEYSRSVSYKKAWHSSSIRDTTYHYSSNAATMLVFIFYQGTALLLRTSLFETLNGSTCDSDSKSQIFLCIVTKTNQPWEDSICLSPYRRLLPA